MEINRKILVIDTVLILGSLIAIAGIIGYTQPFATAPLQSDSTIFTLNNVDYILIDDALDFSSPERIDLNEDVLVSLPSGHYYFKIVGDASEVREMTLEFDLKILFDVSGNEVRVINYGSNDLEVSVYTHGTYTESKSISGENNE
jgi:hypothetical protein